MHVEVSQGYRSGVVGRITEMHALWYAREYGFGQVFESWVATGLADFVGRLANPRNQLWCALDGDRLVRSVGIDAEDLGDGTAHLR